jgi:hypothetical protein
MTEDEIHARLDTINARIAQLENTNMTDERTRLTLMQLLTAMADRAKLDQDIDTLIRTLATEHGISPDCPPVR